MTLPGRTRQIESAAIAGIVYAVLVVVSLILFEQRPVEPEAEEWASWIRDGGNRTRMAVALVIASVAAVAFLWFVGVVRRRVGAREDRFFQTVFLGSALVYVSLWLVAAAIVAAPALAPSASDHVSVDAFHLVEGLGNGLLLVAAPRIQAVFVASASTIFLRTNALPSWVGYLGYAIALVMFVWPFVMTPLGLGLPFFVLVSSVVILVGADIRLGGAVAE